MNWNCRVYSGLISILRNLITPTSVPHKPATADFQIQPFTTNGLPPKSSGVPARLSMHWELTHRHHKVMRLMVPHLAP